MARTKHYHPVKLSNIRYFAAKFGFKIGTIKTLWSDENTHEARYEITIQVSPIKIRPLGLSEIHECLQVAFDDNIRVHWMHLTERGTLKCHLAVSHV